jgi:hypothetical protein
MFAFTDRNWLLRFVLERSDRTKGNQATRNERQAIAPLHWESREWEAANKGGDRSLASQ